MKRIISFLFALLLTLPTLGLAEVDLSGMSFDELVTLRDQIDMAIWESDAWQEVEVPKGVYTIGEDIPVGKWTIKAADGLTAYVLWGDMLDESGMGLSWDGNIFESESLYSPSSSYYDKGDTTEISWELKSGQYLIVDDGIALFAPYAGKPSLGFK